MPSCGLARCGPTQLAAVLRTTVPAQSGERSRVELTFDKPQLLAQLFGQYDQNLVALEHRLGIYITARGNRVGLEGSAEQVAMAGPDLHLDCRDLAAAPGYSCV